MPRLLIRLLAQKLFWLVLWPRALPRFWDAFRLPMREIRRTHGRLPMVLHHWNGSRLRLSSDRVDDLILYELSSRKKRDYFPKALEATSVRQIVDLGAHRGFISLDYLAVFPNAAVVSVEANPGTFRGLEANWALNPGYQNRWTIVSGAVGRGDRSFSILLSRKGSWGDRAVQSTPEATVKGRIPGRSYSDLPFLCRPDLVKVNIEGGEFELVPEILERLPYPRFIILMAHPRCGDIEELLRRLRRCGYRGRQVNASLEHPCFHLCLIEQPTTPK